MNNYSYVTLLSDDSYIFGIILLTETMKKVETKYPLEVLVTSNVTKPILNILDQLGLKYKIIEPIKFDKYLDHNKKVHAQFAKNWALTFSKFEMFKMTEYDKIIFLDTDIMFKKNLDHLFECPNLTCALDGEYFNIWPDQPHFNAGLMVIEPNIEEYDKIIEFTKNYTITENACVADQEILNAYYSDWINNEELHLDKYYNIFAPYIQEEQIEDVEENCQFIHFIGRKPWRAFNKPSNETYTEKYYQDAFAIIQEKVNTLDWIKAKEQVTLTVYAICKDEMKRVEQFLNCFSKADHVCILDTGSVDGTWQYLQAAQKRYPNLIIEQKIFDPWRYDTARNYSLTLVPKDTTMYFMADLDEVIKEDDWAEKVKDAWTPLFSRGAYTYNRQVDPVSGEVIQQFTEYRIHNSGWHYKGVVHEQLCNIADNRIFFADECVNVPIIVWHYPTNPNREAYIELCERGVAEEPLNWLMHLQLAAEYEVHFKYDKAAEEYRKILAEQNGLSIVEIGRCYASLGRSLGILKKDEEALAVLQKGMQIVPTCGDCYFFAAEITYRNNKFKETYDFCKAGVEHQAENQWCTIISRDSYFPYLLMGLSQYYLGNKILGIGYLALAKDKNNNEEISNIYAQIIKEINRR